MGGDDRSMRHTWPRRVEVGMRMWPGLPDIAILVTRASYRVLADTLVGFGETGLPFIFCTEEFFIENFKGLLCSSYRVFISICTKPQPRRF